MTHKPKDMIEIEVTLLSGEGKLLEVHSNTCLKQLRKMLRQAWNCPFITILSDEGGKLDFELPFAWQVSPVRGRISLQAMAQQPIVTCNQNAAVLWCPNNPFLCALGSEYSGNCIDQTGAPYPRPIRQVYAGTHWFLAVKADESMMTWGRRPHILRRDIPHKGKLQDVFSPTEDIVAFLWDEQRLDIWDDRKRAKHPVPLHSWSTVTTVSANMHAVAAILADGRVMAYGVPLGGGILPDLANQRTNRWPAVNLYASRLAFLVTLSNGTAVIWGNLSELGTVLEKTGYGVEHVSSTPYAFAVTWSDGSVTTFGDPERGGDSERVQDRLTSVQMVWSNNAAFAAMTSRSNIVCWGDPKCGGRMETVPAEGVVDIISTYGSFAALTKNGEVRSWGASSLPGQPCLEIPPNVEIVRATSGAFAALHKDGTVTTWGNPEVGGNISLVHNELRAIQWITANSTIFFAGRADHAIVYWGFHTGILTLCCYPAGELGHPKEYTRPDCRKVRGLEASVVWSEGAANLMLEYPPRPGWAG